MPELEETDQSLDEPVAAIILAAGKSTRMHSSLPKPLHPICGLPMTDHVIRSCRAAGVERTIVVVGRESEQVQKGLQSRAEYCLQQSPLGTGDAVRSANSQLHEWPHTILVLAGDTPLILPDTLRSLIALQQNRKCDAAILTMFLKNPRGYGRVIRDENGRALRIVEEKDADSVQKSIEECNPSIYAFHGPSLWTLLDNIRPNNAQGEYYLTDVIGQLASQGKMVETFTMTDPDESLGVNTRVELALVTSIMRKRLLEKLMLSGVTMTDPSSVYIDVDVTVGQDSVIEPQTYLLQGTHTGRECRIGPCSRIERSHLGNNVEVKASWVTDSILADEAKVGPFSQLRPGSVLGEGAKVGNFVELKNTRMGAGSQASHLSYLGDAHIGERANIGAGTITCNYDGFVKHQTNIGHDAFIGSQSTLVAPIHIGAGAFIAAASVITRDVPEDAMAIARAEEIIKEGWAAAYRMRREGNRD